MIFSYFKLSNPYMKVSHYSGIEANDMQTGSIHLQNELVQCIVGKSVFLNQFDTAKINENIVKSIVIGVNTLCSSLFSEIAFSTVFT